MKRREKQGRTFGVAITIWEPRHMSRRNAPRSSTFAGRVTEFKMNNKREYSLNSFSRVVMRRNGSCAGDADDGNDLPSWFKYGRPPIYGGKRSGGVHWERDERNSPGNVRGVPPTCTYPMMVAR